MPPARDEPRTPSSRRQAGSLIALGLLALGGVGWLAVAAARLYADASDTGERASALQALGAAASFGATLILLAVTAWYAILTKGILRQSGPVVDATLRVGWLSPLGAGAGALTAPLTTLSSGPVDERYTVPAWAITLANGGNAGAKVSSVAVESASGFTFRPIDVLAGPSPPFGLEAHSGETVYIELQGVIAGLQAWEEVMGRVSPNVRAEVTLGSGVIVHSRWETLR